jgi:predicted Zn-ribbon and HTH transcriptional regulator
MKINSYKNTGWTVNKIIRLYQKEHPDWTYEECESKAKIVHRELKRMNDNMRNNNIKYSENNMPFSYFDDNPEFKDMLGI